MASEWKQVTFADVIEIISGGTPKTSVPGYWGGSIPWLAVSDFNTGYRWVDTAEKMITDQGLAESATTILNRGDIIISARGTVGVIAQLSKPMAFNQSCYGIRGRQGISETTFVYYALRHAVSQMQQVAHGGVFSTITRDTFKIIEMLLPPLSEQKAIAHILGSLDDKIELNRKMNETLEAMARAIFKAWFVDFEPVRAKMEGRWQRGQSLPGLPAHLYDLFPDRFVDSELGEIPEGWKVGAFSDLVKILRNQENPMSLPSSVFSHFSIPAYDNGQCPKKERGDSIKSLKFSVPPGAVLLSKLNPEISRVWLVDVQPEDLSVCSTEFLVLSPLAPAGCSFVYCLALSPVFRQTLEGLVTGTSKSHQRVQVDSVLNLSITQPGKIVLEEFERMVGTILERVLECRREIRILVELREMSLPKLISGEVLVDQITNNIERCNQCLL